MRLPCFRGRSSHQRYQLPKIVSEVAGGATDASSMSSYELLEDGSLLPISSAVNTTETAACWAIVSPNGRFTYTTNAGSSSISGYRIKYNGSLQLLDEDGVTRATGAGTNPLDMAMSRTGRHLYAISPATQQIVGFRVKLGGGLRHIQSVDVPAARINGLAGF
jgi:6-phosphogluconolactonase